MLLVTAQSFCGVAVASRGERLALPLLPVLLELDRRHRAMRARRAAGVDLGQLAVIPTKDDLGVDSVLRVSVCWALHGRDQPRSTTF